MPMREVGTLAFCCVRPWVVEGKCFCCCGLRDIAGTEAGRLCYFAFQIHG